MLVIIYRHVAIASGGSIISSWTTSLVSLPYSLASHVAVGNGNSFYVIGGATSDDFDNVYALQTGSGGAVTGWTLMNHLPEARYGMASAQRDKYIYVLGGLSYDGSLHFQNSVYFSEVQNSGNLSSWQTSSVLPFSLVEGAATVVGDWIYFAGGTNNSTGMSDNVYVAHINPNGTLGSWSQVIDLPFPMVTFGMIAFQNKIYIIGGNVLGIPVNTVYSANVNPSDGSLSSWHAETSLPQPYADKNQVVLVDNLIVVAGGSSTGGSISKKVFYSKISPDGSLEPWQQSSFDLPQAISAGALTYINGYLYFTGGVAGGYQDKVYYAKVSDGTLGVPLLKQTDPAWGGYIYDGALLWSPLNNTIGGWGCALTSAAMVFQYYGITKLPGGITDLDPGSLNSWLGSQDDGYIGNGLVNWLALTRLSKLAKADNIGFTRGDALEFSRRGHDESQLNSDLSNEIPPILEEPGHFVVAVGTGSGTFKINDPYYNRTDLTEYDDTFISMRRFVPSFTDLSYIMVVADPVVDISLKNSLGEAVGDSYTQNPILNPLIGTVSGDAVKILMDEKPGTDVYRLSLSSSSGKSYSVKIYLYDEDGNVKIGANTGIVGPGDSDEFVINFNKLDSENSNSNKNVTVSSFMDDLNSLCRLGDISKNKCIPLIHQARVVSSSNPSAARALLTVMDREISNNKSGQVSNNAYNILHADIQALLASL